MMTEKPLMGQESWPQEHLKTALHVEEMAKDPYLFGQVVTEVDIRITVTVTDMQHQYTLLPLVVRQNPDRFHGIRRHARLR